MDIAKKRALIAFSIIIVGFVIYQLIAYYYKWKSNVVSRYYTKTYDLCRVLSRCSEHSYNNTDLSDPSYIRGKEDSKKRCLTTKTNLSWRKDFACQYNDIDDISTCYDCLDSVIEIGEDGKEFSRCGTRRHDIDRRSLNIPNYKECLDIMGTTEMLDKRVLLQKYDLNITDLNDETRKYKGLTDDWWGKHDHLYKCLTSHPDYVDDKWDDGFYNGYGYRSPYRLFSCSTCFEDHGDNVDDFKECMRHQADCFKNNYRATGCDRP